jgi:hypothetical protein
MIKEAYIAGEQAALEKVGSTAFSRHLAKGLGGTPKSVTKPVYNEAMKRSGKTGVDAFRHTTGRGQLSSRGVPKPTISISDPMNRRPDRQTIRGVRDNYTSSILAYKRKNKRVPRDTAKGTIATNPKVRANRFRKNTVGTRGVGDLKFGTAKEKTEARAAYQKSNTNMDPDLYKRRIAKAKLNAREVRESNPQSAREGSAHDNLITGLKRKGYIRDDS